MDQNNHPIGIKHGYKDFEPWPLINAERSFRAGSELKDVLLTENYLATTSNFVFPRRCFEHVGGFRPLRFAHDWDFALRISRIADLILLPEPLLSYRIHPQNTIRKSQNSMIFEICWILAVHLPRAVEDPEFLGSEASEKRIDQLLNSIYTFNCDRVLNMLLLMKLHEQPELALKLLQPQNPIRTRLIEHIQEEKSRQSSSVSASGTQFIWAAGLISRLKRAFRKDLD